MPKGPIRVIEIDLLNTDFESPEQVEVKACLSSLLNSNEQKISKKEAHEVKLEQEHVQVKLKQSLIGQRIENKMRYHVSGEFSTKINAVTGEAEKKKTGTNKTVRGNRRYFELNSSNQEELRATSVNYIIATTTIFDGPDSANERKELEKEFAITKQFHGDVELIERRIENKQKTKYHIKMAALGDNLHSTLGQHNYSELSYEDRFNCLEQLYAEMEKLHEMGYIHADIKLENILYRATADGAKIHLIDFGNATKISPDAKLPGGTPGYLPKEYFTQQPCDARADTYASMPVLVDLLLGSRDFINLGKMQSEINGVYRDYDLSQVPRELDFTIPALQKVLVDVITLGSSRDPSERPTATQMREFINIMHRMVQLIDRYEPDHQSQEELNDAINQILEDNQHAAEFFHEISPEVIFEQTAQATIRPTIISDESESDEEGLEVIDIDEFFSDELSGSDSETQVIIEDLDTVEAIITALNETRPNYSSIVEAISNLDNDDFQQLQTSCKDNEKNLLITEYALQEKQISDIEIAPIFENIRCGQLLDRYMKLDETSENYQEDLAALNEQIIASLNATEDDSIKEKLGILKQHCDQRLENSPPPTTGPELK